MASCLVAVCNAHRLLVTRPSTMIATAADQQQPVGVTSVNRSAFPRCGY